MNDINDGASWAYRLSRKVRKLLPYVAVGALTFVGGCYVGNRTQAKQNRVFYITPIQVPGFDMPLENIVTQRDFGREHKFNPNNTLVKIGNYRVSLPVALACVDGKVADLAALSRKGISGISDKIDEKDGRKYLVMTPTKATANVPVAAVQSDDDEE
ncbi:MAG: hypothetical protein AABW88_03730 [Nanoarchaeota archaeon]